MLQISSSALNEIKRIQRNQMQSDIPLKLSISSGGCSGLFYELKLANITDREEFFSGDRFDLVKINDVSLIIDRTYAEYINNLKIDYAEDLMGGGFRFHNPQAQNICGCGISFKIKNF